MAITSREKITDTEVFIFLIFRSDFVLTGSKFFLSRLMSWDQGKQFCHFHFDSLLNGDHLFALNLQNTGKINMELFHTYILIYISNTETSTFQRKCLRSSENRHF